MPSLSYPATVDRVAPNDFEVRFRDFPEAITGGPTPVVALEGAPDALAAVVETYLSLGRPLPPQRSAEPGEHSVRIEQPATAAARQAS